MTRRLDSSRIKLKRVYEPAAPSDGVRVLVDRLWPRGLSKADVATVHWYKDVAPSAALRQWFGHKPERWDEFRKRYKSELARQPEALGELRELARKSPVTLLFAAHDELHSNAVVLRELLLAERPKRRTAIRSAGKSGRKT